MAKKQPAPEEKAILRAMDEKSKKSLRLNFILQGFTLLTAIASLVMFFVDDNRGLDTTVFQLMQCVMALVIFNVPLFISRKFKCYIPNFITIFCISSSLCTSFWAKFTARTTIFCSTISFFTLRRAWYSAF